MEIPSLIFDEPRAMRTNMAQTSLESYIRLHEEGNMGKRQQQVYTQISGTPGISDREISETLGLPINSVCGRRNELVDKGFVVQKGLKYDETTKRMVMTWRSI